MDLKLLKKIRVLYVEDDVEVVEHITSTLKLFFDEILIAYSGEEGIKLFETQKPLVVITDIDLPNMSGVELIRHIRKIDKTIPVLVTTSYDDKKMLIDLIPLGVTQFLLKPLNFNKLTSAFEEILDNLANNKKLEYKFSNGVIYDIFHENLSYDISKIKLSPKEMSLFQLLFSRMNTVISYEVIEEDIWNDYENHRESLKTYVANIRKVIGKEYLVNIQDIGYKLVIE